MRTLLLFNRLISRAFNVHCKQYIGQLKPFIASSSRSTGPRTMLSYDVSNEYLVPFNLISNFMSMKNSNDANWNRTRDLPICSTAP